MILRPYQVPHTDKLLGILADRGVAHDGSDTGVGKTFCAAAIAAKLQVETLVVCPLSVAPTWRTILADAGVNASVINFESCWRQYGGLVKWGKGSFFKFSQLWPLTIYDEVHRSGGETTINSKLLIASKRAGGRILTLSATAADSVLKLKALGYTLKLHGLSNYREWLFSHGARDVPIYGRGGRPVMRKDGQPATKLDIGKRANTAAMQVLHEQIFGSGNRGSRMRIADIPDFPSTHIEVRMIDGASRELNRLSDELQTYIKQRNALGAYSDEVLAKLVFWRQAAETEKIPHFIDMIEDALETSKCALFVSFNKTVDELVAECDKRGWTSGVIRGDQSEAERQSAITRFQANELDVIVCNIMAGGVGVSLHDPMTKYPRTALFSPCWSGRDLKQGLGRVHRDGGGFSRQFILCWSTGIEARVAGSVRRKIDDLSLLNDFQLDQSFSEPEEQTATAQRALSI